MPSAGSGSTSADWRRACSGNSWRCGPNTGRRATSRTRRSRISCSSSIRRQAATTWRSTTCSSRGSSRRRPPRQRRRPSAMPTCGPPSSRRRRSSHSRRRLRWHRRYSRHPHCHSQRCRPRRRILPPASPAACSRWGACRFFRGRSTTMASRSNGSHHWASTACGCRRPHRATCSPRRGRPASGWSARHRNCPTWTCAIPNRCRSSLRTGIACCSGTWAAVWPRGMSRRSRSVRGGCGPAICTPGGP